MFGDGGIRIPLLFGAGGLCRHPLTGAERTSALYSIVRVTAVRTEAFFARCFPEGTQHERTRAAEPLAWIEPGVPQNGSPLGWVGCGTRKWPYPGGVLEDWKHLVSSWRWVSTKNLPLGVSLWGKSVYTSFCVEQGLTLKGLPSSRDATAFSPLAAASKKRRSSDTLSSRRRFEFQVPRTRNICASVCLGRQAGPLLLVLV